jgi:hypothetical protein
MTVATYGGLLWAGVVKVALRYGWRRLTAPKASHRGARQLTRLRPTYNGTLIGDSERGRRADDASHRSDALAAGQERSRRNGLIIAGWLSAGRSYFAWHAD